MDLGKLKKVFFLGIGGIGMSAIARYFNSNGVAVYGYDKTASSLTKKLEEEGMKIHYDEDLSLIPEDLDLVVYTPAIPKSNLEFKYFEKQEDLPFLKRAVVLGKICSNGFTVAIAGSHGKTTITAMLAHVLNQAGFSANAFIGGISVNYESNFLPGEKEVYIVEADEYDRSFHQLFPDIAVITAIDDDHLEVYGNRTGILKSFAQFIENIDPKGTLIIKEGLEANFDFLPEQTLSYHLISETAHCYAKNLQTGKSQYNFEARILTTRSEKAGVSPLSFILKIGGKHNVENSIPVIAIAKKMGLTDQQIVDGLSTFKGIKRRFEYVLRSEKLTIIDDYAHHPNELNALIDSVKELYPEEKVIVVFQPHLFSRTADLATEFAAALSKADEAILLEIYPARELPRKGVSAHLILNKLNNGDPEIFTVNSITEKLEEKLKEEIKRKKTTVLVIAGAGDIGNKITLIKERLTAILS